MRRLAAILAATALVLFAATLIANAPWTPSVTERAAHAPDSGMALLNALRCRPAETRHVILRGVEDAFSADGVEDGRQHLRLESSIRRSAYFDNSGYDVEALDQVFQDYLEIPTRIASGLFVIALRELDSAGNDDLVIGDLTTLFDEARLDAPRYLRLRISEIDRSAGWSRAGDLYWARLDDIRLQSGDNLLTDIRSGPGNGLHIVDILASDDTMVDFVGLSVCVEPEPGHGLAMRVSSTPTVAITAPGYLVVECIDGTDNTQFCDAYRGNADCAEPRPLLCFHDDGDAAPIDPGSGDATDIQDFQRQWSGGRLALSDAQAAGRFANIGEADAYCAAQFGDRWRVADYHLGGQTPGFIGRGDAIADRVMAWVDIRDQPYATCWRRERGNNDD